MTINDPIYYDYAGIQAAIGKYAGLRAEEFTQELRLASYLRANDITNVLATQSGVVLLLETDDVHIRLNKYGYYFWDVASKRQMFKGDSGLAQLFGVVTVMGSLEEALRAAERMYELAV